MNNSTNNSEPPSQYLARYCPMLVGRNSRGHWVARSQDGLCGGLFVNRTEALRFALFENGHRPDAVILVTGNLELALNDPASVREAGESARRVELLHRAMRSSMRDLKSRRQAIAAGDNLTDTGPTARFL